MSDKTKDNKEAELTFPSAVYKDGTSKLVNNQEEADAAEKDGWSNEPPSAEAEPDRDRPGQGLPGVGRPGRPDQGLPGGGDRPHPEPPIAETPKPKKKD